MAMEYWTPETEGKHWEPTPILTPLEPFRDQVLVLSGLRASWGQVHNGASTSFLTGTPQRTVRGETDIRALTSLDQLLAREVGQETQLPSLELSLDPKGYAGQCSGGLSCAYINTISWRSPTQPLPMEDNPRAVFERLFGDSGTTAPAARLARLTQKKSVLDSVAEKLADLQREIGPADRTKIDEFTEAVRDVERRIEIAEAQSDIELPLLEQPQGVPPVFADHLKLMLDLQILAFRTDLTRIITFMVGREQNSRTYPEIGVPEAHHPLSHHENVPAKIAQMSKINVYHVKLFSDFLGRLRATADGDGSLLDHMTIMYGSGISNSTQHRPENIPLLLVGGGAGRLRSGRHIKYAGDISISNLLVTLMDKFDVPVERMGDSTRPLDIDTLSDL
jgi:hypothetical protein